MKTKFRISLIVLMLLLGLPPAYLLTSQSGDAEPPLRRAHLGDTDALYRNFVNWGMRHEERGGDGNVLLRLAWTKGLSAKPSQAKGTVRLDLIQGSVKVEVEGLDPEGSWDVWLLDGEAARGKDRKIRLGTLAHQGNRASLWRFFGSDFFDGVEVDRVVVARSQQDPEVAGVLHAAPSLFQWLHTRLRVGSSEPRTAVAESLFGVRPAFAQLGIPPVETLDQLIARGAKLFFQETFDGNGRTCGTCHPAENNFTIDPKFIATLPKTDKLFIAEDPNFPQLAELEKPALMRRFGVILENVDGAEDPTNKFVLRGVPHTLALMTSLTPSMGDPTTIPPVERTGWSGDGAPDDGSLFAFAKGAVFQHFTLSLARRPGVDFTEPTDSESRAMEAFQLSLGRHADLDLSTMTFSDPIVQEGLEIFNSPVRGKCFFCHNNAGANASFDPTNRNFDTGVERQDALPIQVFDPSIPLDGGFGKTAGDCDLPGTFGNCTFNTTPLVEAADTGPFFHNDSMDTIEAAVGFYNTDAFNNSPNGNGISMSGSEVQAVASFLRAINAQENLRNAIVQEEKLLSPSISTDPGPIDLLAVAMAETLDAIEVLEGANLHLNLIPELEDALKLLDQGTASAIRKAIEIQKKVSVNIGT